MIDFANFEMLKNSRNLSAEDAALAVELNCVPAVETSWEDRRAEVLISWLTQLSGIEWRMAFEHGERRMNQYGTLQLLGVTGRGMSQRVSTQSADGLKICDDVIDLKEYQYQIDVYRDRGQIDSGQQGVADANQRSAFDVLDTLQTRSKHYLARAALGEYCIQMTRGIEAVRNLPPELRKETYEARATAYLWIAAPVSSSMSIGTVGGFELTFCGE